MKYKDFEYEIIDQEVRIIKYLGTNTKVFVPVSIDGYDVTVIGEQAFYGKYSLDFLFLPHTLKRIERLAFSHTGISLLYIPESGTTIEAEAFSYNQLLKKVFMAENVKSIDPTAFIACPQLDGYYIDENNPYYTSIDGILFSKDLTSLIKYPDGKQDSTYIVPDTITKIENNAFAFCSYLKNIELPQHLEHIGSWAFVKCYMEEIVIPDSVKYMGEGVFYNCKQLKKVTLSKNLSHIQPNTFAMCIKLKNITIPKSVAILDCLAFIYCNSDLTIKVYKNCQLENKEALDLNFKIIKTN